MKCVIKSKSLLINSMGLRVTSWMDDTTLDLYTRGRGYQEPASVYITDENGSEITARGGGMNKYELIVGQAGMALVELYELKMCLEGLVKSLARLKFCLVTGIRCRTQQ